MYGAQLSRVLLGKLPKDKWDSGVNQSLVAKQVTSVGTKLSANLGIQTGNGHQRSVS